MAKETITEVVREFLKEYLLNVEEQLAEIVERILNKRHQELLKLIKKGIKGDKGDLGKAGKDADEIEIIKKILKQIPKPKDADEEKIIGSVLKSIPKSKNGKDGSPDTPKQIVSKINTLEEVIEQKTIIGFKKLIRTLQNNIRESKAGGGGMGNVQHEVFTIQAVTTTVQTAFTIAANGNAVMNFTYQNARLEMTNHFTVGTDRRTITFNSDVQVQFKNSTTAAMTYIRG